MSGTNPKTDKSKPSKPVNPRVPSEPGAVTRQQKDKEKEQSKLHTESQSDTIHQEQAESIGKLTQKIKELEQVIHQQEQDLQQKDSELQGKNKELQQKDQVIDQQRDLVQQGKAQLITQNKENQSLKSETHTLGNQVAKLTADLQARKSELVSEEVTSLTQQLREKRVEIIQVTEELKTQKELIATTSEEYQTKIRKLEDQVSNSDKELVLTQYEVDQLNKDRKTLERENQDLLIQIDLANRELGKLRAEDTIHKSQIKRFETDLEKEKEHRRENHKRFASVSSRVSELELLLEQANRQIESLKTKKDITEFLDQQSRTNRGLSGAASTSTATGTSSETVRPLSNLEDTLEKEREESESSRQDRSDSVRDRLSRSREGHLQQKSFRYNRSLLLRRSPTETEETSETTVAPSQPKLRLRPKASLKTSVLAREIAEKAKQIEKALAEKEGKEKASTSKSSEESKEQEEETHRPSASQSDTENSQEDQ